MPLSPSSPFSPGCPQTFLGAMSSTYMHYGTPSSLPSDYGLLARYANAHGHGGEAPHEPTRDNDPSAIDSAHEVLHDTIDELSEGTSSGAGTARRASSSSHLRPTRPHGTTTTMGGLPAINAEGGAPRVPAPITTNENAPLLIPRIREDVDERPGEPLPPAADMFWEELKLLGKYTLPILGYVFLYDILTLVANTLSLARTHALEYSLIVASVVSIGHLSTAALAASTLGSMTASVTGYSIIQGFASTLDTMLPAAWTSDNPKLVGLWSQRLSTLIISHLARLTSLTPSMQRCSCPLSSWYVSRTSLFLVIFGANFRFHSLSADRHSLVQRREHPSCPPSRPRSRAPRRPLPPLGHTRPPCICLQLHLPALLPVPGYVIPP